MLRSADSDSASSAGRALSYIDNMTIGHQNNDNDIIIINDNDNNNNNNVCRLRNSVCTYV